MLLRLDFFPGNQIHSGINDNLFYYTVDISSAAWPAQRAPCACIAERRGRLPTRMLRRVRRSGQEQRYLRLPANGGGRGPSGHAGCLWLPKAAKSPRCPRERTRTCFGEQRRGSVGLTGRTGVSAWGHRGWERDRLLSAE